MGRYTRAAVRKRGHAGEIVPLVWIVSTPGDRDNSNTRYRGRIGQSPPFPAADHVLEDVKLRGGLVEGVGYIAGNSGPCANIPDACGLDGEQTGEPELARVELDGGLSAFT